MELEDETRLVARLLSGDSGALEQFVFTYRRFITAVLRHQPDFCSEDVEELYQRFLLHIWEDGYRRLRSWRGTRSLRSYLGAVARNLARDYRREQCRGWAAARASFERTVSCGSEPATEPSHYQALRRALAQLPARDRDLIHRRSYLEESYREIAQALGMTVNHVGVRLFRAESRLKVILQKFNRDL